jgi:hypothetical protein
MSSVAAFGNREAVTQALNRTESFTYAMIYLAQVYRPPKAPRARQLETAMPNVMAQNCRSFCSPVGHVPFTNG